MHLKFVLKQVETHLKGGDYLVVVMNSTRPVAEHLVDDALETLGLKGRTMANFRKIALEMEIVLGESISAITIYRMVNVKNSQHKPYRYSLELLERFIELSKSAEIYRQNKNRFYTSKNPRESALYQLINSLLSNESLDSLLEFMNKLPVGTKDLGWERHIIAYALNDFFKSKRKIISTNRLVESLLQCPQFSIYYIETYVDFSKSTYYKYIIEEYIKYAESIRLNELLKHPYKFNIEQSILFAHSISIYLTSLGDIFSTYNHTFYYFFNPETEQFIEQLQSKNPILYTRATCAKLILTNSKNMQRVYEKLCEELLHYKLKSLIDFMNSFEKAFSLGIILDTFLLCNDKENFEGLLSNINIPIHTYSEEPQINRLMIYQCLKKGLLEKVKEIENQECNFSEGELPINKKLIQKASNWLIIRR